MKISEIMLNIIFSNIKIPLEPSYSFIKLFFTIYFISKKSIFSQYYLLLFISSALGKGITVVCMRSIYHFLPISNKGFLNNSEIRINVMTNVAGFLQKK